MDQETDNILLPLNPTKRYSMLTDELKIQVITSVEGDMVTIEGEKAVPCNGKHGIIRYIGPISLQNEALNNGTYNRTWAERLQISTSNSTLDSNPYCGTWFGIEIVVSRNMKNRQNTTRGYQIGL